MKHTSIKFTTFRHTPYVVDMKTSYQHCTFQYNMKLEIIVLSCYLSIQQNNISRSNFCRKTKVIKAKFTNNRRHYIIIEQTHDNFIKDLCTTFYYYCTWRGQRSTRVKASLHTPC